MKVVITGGAGLIGRNLAANLVENGHEVVILSRSPEKQTGKVSDVRVVGWDGKTSAGWGREADGAGAIVNLAGESIGSRRWNAARKRAILESRVNAGKAVMESIRRASVKPQVLIQSSAVAYYGPRGDELVNEQAAMGSDFLAQVCREWEASSAPAQSLGVRLVVIRSGIVLSMQGGALPRLVLPFRFFAGGRLGSGKQWFPWIHMDDEVAAIRFLMENPAATGVFNLAAPNPRTNADYASVIGKVMGRPAFMPVPAFALRLLLGEMSTVVLDGQRQIPEHLVEMGFKFKYEHAEPALRSLLH